jgi:hypothetical protein
MMMPPLGNGEFRSAWVAVTGPEMLGKVDFKADLRSLRCPSASASGSEPRGLVITRSLIYVADSRDMFESSLGGLGRVWEGNSHVKGQQQQQRTTALTIF